ncbi:MAG: hypothetical protein H8E19_07860 [Deltaproteobacteria bacterium]|uniref:Uncharacterized protein n=1 Tax=Candidatus Desulfacyla euxinica TaxID=2841693 RepID=A0A8J6T884_9DELT|nr:hypothetical protein [Candidatus Desulfacyla euxinica]
MDFGPIRTALFVPGNRPDRVDVVISFLVVQTEICRFLKKRTRLPELKQPGREYGDQRNFRSRDYRAC